MTAKEHLEWATQRAMQYFDAGDRNQAFTSFMSDVNKHDGTQYIATHDFAAMHMMLMGTISRHDFEKFCSGWSVL